MNRFSKTITQNKSQGGSQAMLYALGLKPNDLKKAQIGIGSVWYEGNPCNVHLNTLAKHVKKGLNKYYNDSLLGFRFNTVGISDGISMGTDGMKFSLPSREIIADSIETIMKGQHYDGNISIAGCDKNLPGCLMGMIRVNRPSLMLYGGSIAAGKYNNKKVDIVSAFQSYGELLNNKITDKERTKLLQCCCPGAGSCGGMYTANTMASAIEAMGMILPNGSSNLALSPDKIYESGVEAPMAIFNMLEKNIRPSDIITKESIENSITTMIALGGSTNGVLHLLAIAKTANIKLGLDDFRRINNRVPLIANLKPHGEYVMEDIYNNGGLKLFLKYLLEKGMLHGDCLTVTGKTLEENLNNINLETTNKLCPKIYSIEKPLKNTGHIKIFKGNIASGGSVGKITGNEGNYFKGPANVFDSEKKFMTALKNGYIIEGDVVVIRFQGPKGGPGMPEMLKPTSSIAGYGLNGKIALITDGRFSGGSHGFIIGHVTPEALIGGNIGIIENGDIIEIDASNDSINVKLSDYEIMDRQTKQKKKLYNIKQERIKTNTGYLNKYSCLVSSASEGCVTDYLLF